MKQDSEGRWRTMNINHVKYETLPFPMERQVTIQGGRLASRKHTIHALIEVDVNTMVEAEAGGRKRVIPHWVRAANKRTLRDIHDEIRTTKAKPEQTREFGVKWLGLLPAFIWDIFFCLNKKIDNKILPKYIII